MHARAKCVRSPHHPHPAVAKHSEHPCGDITKHGSATGHEPCPNFQSPSSPTQSWLRGPVWLPASHTLVEEHHPHP